jgi:hypothetical protein
MTKDLPQRVWSMMSPAQRKYQQAADSFVAGYIRTVFGEGPYPPCLCGAVRSYFFLTGDSSQVARALAHRRQDDAAKLLRVVVNAPNK